MLTLIVALLVFAPKYNTNGASDNNVQQETNESNNNNSGSDNDNSNGSKDESTDDNEDKEEEVEEIYANDITVNHLGDIITYVNVPVYIDEGFVSVEPADFMNSLTYRITSRYNSDTSAVNFDGKIFTSSKVGQYNLIYTVPNTNSKMLEAKVVIIVKESDETIVQKKDIINVGDNIDLSEYFNVYLEPFEEIKYITDDKVSLNSNKLQAIKSGESSIIIKISKGKVSREYLYKIYVRELPKYFIELSTADGNILDDAENVITTRIGSYMLGCTVYNINNDRTPQDIKIIIDNQSITEVLLASDGLVIFNCKGKGRVKVDIIFNLDTSIRRTIYFDIV